MLNNIDISFLVAPNQKKLIKDYCLYLNLGWNGFSRTSISAQAKLEKLELLEKALRQEYKIKKNLISRLQENFISENLSLSLLLDSLTAWRYLANNKFPDSEQQFADLTNYAISPLGRMIMALHNESPTTYLPLNALLIFFLQMRLITEKSFIIKNIRFNKRQKISKLKGLLKTSTVILSIVKSKMLKFKLAICLNYAHKMLQKLENNKQLKISVVDYLSIFLYSMWQFLSVRTKTISNKGI